VDVPKVWLKDDIDDTAYFPYPDGSFRLEKNFRVQSSLYYPATKRTRFCYSYSNKVYFEIMAQGESEPVTKVLI